MQSLRHSLCRRSSHAYPGIKLLLLAAPTLPNAPALLQQAYEAYADLVMKNPFYSPEMPVRIPRFDERVRQIVGGS